MRRFLFTVLVLIVTAGGVKSPLADNNSIRYRVTVTVDTPEGQKSGSAVRVAACSHEERILPGQGGTFCDIVAGEAVVVDLSERGVLFSTMAGEREAKWVFAELKQRDTAKQPYPYLLIFHQLADLSTAEKISPDKLREVFGGNVTLKEITIEKTDEKAVAKIEGFLPWLKNIQGEYLRGGSSLSSPLGLMVRNFIVR